MRVEGDVEVVVDLPGRHHDRAVVLGLGLREALARVCDDEVERQWRDRPWRVHLVEPPEALDLVRPRKDDLVRGRHVEPPVRDLTRPASPAAPAGARYQPRGHVRLPDAQVACPRHVSGFRLPARGRRSRRFVVRRTLGRSLVVAGLARRPAGQAGAAASRHREPLVLLGTAGGAFPKSTRAGYANAVVVGDAAYLVDCGEGVHSQLWRAGLAISAALRHGSGRWCGPSSSPTCTPTTSWTSATSCSGSWPSQSDRHLRAGAGRPPDPRRSTPGVRPLPSPTSRPPGCEPPLDHLLRAFAYNINVRVAGEGRSDVTERIRVHEIGVRRRSYRRRHRPRRVGRPQLAGSPPHRRWTRSSSIPRTTTACR